MEQHKILKINFSHFPVDDNSAQIPGNLFLIDNFDEPLKKADRNDVMTFPVQITMVVFLFCRQGRISVNINLKEQRIYAGCACVVLPGSLFQLTSVSEDVECAMMAINKDFVDFARDVKMGMEFGRAIKEHPVTQLDYTDMEEMLYIYRSLKHKLYQKDFKYKEDIARSYLNIMRCNAFQRFSSLKEIQTESNIVTNRKEELFTLFISNLQKYYRDERNVSFYADKLCVTPKYLSAVIHEVSGKYATDWITDYVILEAKNMLRVEGRSVKDVCNTLNFANQSFFAKYFKQHTSYTPKEYKNLK